MDSLQRLNPSSVVTSVRKAQERGDTKSNYEYLLDDFCDIFSKVDVFPQPPDLVRWSEDGECYEICWFSHYYIVIDPNDGNNLFIQFRMFGEKATDVLEFKSFEDLKEFCYSNKKIFQF